MEPPVRADPVPATVLRSVTDPFPQHGVLGVIRSLGRMGVPVTLASPAPAIGVAAASRYVRSRRRWEAGPGGIDLLLALADRSGPSVLIATDDASAVFCDEHAAVLRERFIMPACPDGLARRLIDKASLAEVAAAAGVRTPSSRVVHGAAETRAFLETTMPPVIVKAGEDARRAGGLRSVTLAATAGEACALAERARGEGVLLQELVPGSPRTSNWMFDGYFDAAGRCRFWGTARKVAQHPPYTGTATHAITERNDAVAEMVIGFLGGLGYAGPVDVDVRADAEHGDYVVLDVNPRVGGTFRAFVAGGLDPIRATYLDLTGSAVPDVSVPDGRIWVLETHVAASFVAYRRDGWVTLGTWLRSLAGVDEGALLGLDDLRPAVRAVAHMGARALRKLTGADPSPRGSSGAGTVGEGDA